MTELDLILRRHSYYSAKIENPHGKVDRSVTWPEIIVAVSTNEFVLKCNKVKNFDTVLRSLLQNHSHGTGKTAKSLHCQYFPEKLHLSRKEQIKESRRRAFIWPWYNEAAHFDILLTLGLLIITFLQLYAFSKGTVPLQLWTWTEISAAAFLYLWSAACFTYTIMMLR